MKRLLGWITLMLVSALALTSCGGTKAPQPSAQHTPVATTSSAPRPYGSTMSPSAYASTSAVTVPGGDPYVRLAQTLEGLGVQVWFETDLVKAWLAGPAQLDKVVTRLGVLARSTRIVGFKIADELGYNDGINSPQQVLAFLNAVVPAVHKVAPGAKILIDILVPALGCLPWLSVGSQQCASDARASYPADADTAIASYVRTGLIDRVDLSTGMLSPAMYTRWGTTIQDAQRAVWQHVEALGWGSLTKLQSRRALAGPGGYVGDTARDLATFVDIPTAGGAGAVDVWTWRQPNNGQIVSLLPPDLHPNGLWTGLMARHQKGVHLITHMTPSMMPADPAAFEHECKVVAQVFDEIFVAAGTG